MAAWSWRTWPDALIDFGREAYVAWRLTEGAVLHRDVVYVSGPLSPYWNALAFRLFGVGLDTLFAINGALLAALTFVWYALLRSVADRLAAWGACVVLLALFGFGQYVGIGNYNYIAPYSHELPHGLLLASVGFLAWQRAASRPPSVWDVAAGLCLGLVALTKIEVLAAAGAANAAAFALLAMREPGGRVGRRLGLFAAGAVAPVAIATALLAGPLGLTGALEAIAVGALRLLGDDLAALPFYQRGLGSDAPLANAGLALLWAAKITALFVPAWAVATRLAPGRFRPLPTLAGSALVMLVVLAPFVRDVGWLHAARALPVFMLLGVGLGTVAWLRGGDSDRVGTAPLLRLVLAVFATALLAKIFLNARILQYGFALAMPATLLLVTALVCWIPRRLSQRGANGLVFRGAALGVLVVAIAGHLLAMQPFFEDKRSRLGGVDDAFRVNPGLARVLGLTLEDVNARTRPGDSIAVLPEGVMLNFLTRRPTPTPHFSFNPFELLVYGESAMIEALAASPPAAIVLVHHDTSEHGARFLGRDYGRDLMGWIRENYRAARQLGDPPLQPGTRWGVQILEPNR